jgi:NRPS condensation-like uncharacterized protein
MVCGLYLTLDRAPDLPRLRSRLSALVETFPRLRDRIVEHRAGPVWTPDRGFEVDAHLTHSDAGGLGHTDIVERLAARMRERLDPELPPWQLSVWGGEDCHGLWLRWHHALSDGEGMLQLLGALADSDIEPDTSRELRRLSPALGGEHKPRAHGAARVRASGLLWKLVRRREPSPRVLGSDRFRVLPILEQIDAPTLSRLQARWSVSTNELLIGLAAGAIVRYERRHGRAMSSLRVLSPISDRPQSSDVQLGNLSRALRPSIDLESESHELPSTAELMARARAASRAEIEHGKAVPYGVYRLVFGLPTRLRDRVFAKGPKYIVNYMPWARDPQWIAGARVERIHGFTPMLPFHGCTFACTNYRGQLHASLVCDARLLEQPELMVECLHEALADAPQR